MDKNNILRIIKEFGLIFVGCMIYAFAWAGIIEPAGGMGGGASGLSLLIQYATGLPMGVGFAIINSILILLALVILGKNFGIKSIWGIGTIALWLNIYGAVLPDDLLGLADDKLLSSILGGVVSGLGVAICLMQGGSTGGTDIVAMIINKYRRVSYGRIVIMGDAVIIGSAYFVYNANPDFVGNPLAMIIYGYVMVGVFSYTVDAFLAGNRQSSQLFIFSRHHEEIADGITHRLHRGVTIIDGTGAYTGQQSKMLIVICRKYETNNVMRVVKQHDPEAFVSVGSVMGVYGKGFEKIEVKNKKSE
ncbi:MAG: YitT family protein [Alistipes sp.]|jgi:uncharacterized membrane-anchored protein YitT (DUF2179 family)|nr:YitT family protein [Alistipes sp.]